MKKPAKSNKTNAGQGSSAMTVARVRELEQLARQAADKAHEAKAKFKAARKAHKQARKAAKKAAKTARRARLELLTGPVTRKRAAPRSPQAKRVTVTAKASKRPKQRGTRKSRLLRVVSGPVAATSIEPPPPVETPAIVETDSPTEPTVA